MPQFPYDKAKNLYEESKHNWNCDKTFEDFSQQFGAFLFAGFFQSEFKGVLYYHHWTDDFCFMSGFARLKNSMHIAQAIKILNKHILDNYNIKYILTEPSTRAAKICDLRNGFKVLKDNLLVYKEI